MAGGIRKAVANAGVRAGKAVLGEDRYNALVAFVDAQIKAVQDTVAGIRKSIDGVVDKISKAWDTCWKPKQATDRRLHEGAVRAVAEAHQARSRPSSTTP